MKPTIKSHWLLLLISLYFTTVLNLSLWRYAWDNIELTGVSMAVFAASVPLVLFLALVVIFGLFLWPYVGKPILAVFLIVSSVANYMMFHYGLYIDSDMARNVFETTSREAFDYVNLSAVLWLVFTGLTPALLISRVRIIYRSHWKEILARALILGGSLAVIGLVALVAFKEYAVFGRNNKEVTRLINPSNYVSALIRYHQRQALSKRPFVRIDEEASRAPFKDSYHTVFILVVGETARSMNFSLNGYERDTNPRLARENVISFRDVTASGTSTAVSLPSMFSSLSRLNFDLNEAVYSENFLDLLQNTGYRIWWRDNDDGCKKVCDRVPTEYMVIANNPKYCDGTYCYDDTLLDGLEDFLKTVNEDTFIILHTMGSHGPSYYKRYPEKFKAFTPTCDTSEIQNCERQAIVNTYDNTILYTDHVVAEVIDILKKFPNFEAGLLYVSDHGESLGENNVYLHGLPFAIAPDEQTKVPMILWMSEVMQKEDHINYDCLKGRASEPLAHDNLFHSMVGLMELNTKVYDENLDMFQPCRLKDLPMSK